MREIDSLFPKKPKTGRGKHREMTDVLFKMYADGHVTISQAARNLNMSEETFQRKFEASPFFTNKSARRKANAR